MPAGNDGLLGWNGPCTEYTCADVVKVRVKRRETVMFTRKEQVNES